MKMPGALECWDGRCRSWKNCARGAVKPHRRITDEESRGKPATDHGPIRRTGGRGSSRFIRHPGRFPMAALSRLRMDARNRHQPAGGALGSESEEYSPGAMRERPGYRHLA